MSIPVVDKPFHVGDITPARSDNNAESETTPHSRVVESTLPGGFNAGNHWMLLNKCCLLSSKDVRYMRSLNVTVD